MKVGSLIKCKGEKGWNQTHFGTKRPDQFGVIIKLEGKGNGGTGDHTWAEIQWHDGHRTWEEMECSLEHKFEVIG
jgi:hypothetical protein